MANQVLKILHILKDRFKIQFICIYVFQESEMGSRGLLIWSHVFAKFVKLRYFWCNQLSLLLLLL